MADLPDYYTQAAIAEAEAAKFKGGLAANRSLTPVSRDIYLGTDNHVLYVCVVDGAWTGFDAATLTQGILTLYANMLGGGFRITNIADPTAAQDAATRAYVLAQKALCLLLAGGTMAGNIVMGGNKVTGLGAPAAQDDALRYNRAEIRNAEIAAGAAILVSKLVNTYFPETLMTAQGDILVRGAANPERLAKITTGEFLKATATGYEGGTPPAPRTIATGSYTGNGGDDRQITVGFKCSLVFAWYSQARFGMLIPNAPVKLDSAITGTPLTGGTVLHATDGFTVYDTTDGMNVNTWVFYYWAISE